MFRKVKSDKNTKSVSDKVTSLMSFFIITVPICIMISIFFSIMDRSKFNKLGILRFCGDHSLELYLFHERILTLIGSKLEHLGVFNMNVICILTTFIIAVSWKKIINFIIKGRNKNLNKLRNI